MKILIDQNISFRLLQRIATLFPEATHVKSLDLIDANDYHIFMTARQSGFAAIFTQDEDFHSLLLEHNPPPKIVWFRTGNCSTAFLAEIIQIHADLIHEFLDDPSQDCLEIYGQ